jgi:hypothetical protein
MVVTVKYNNKLKIAVLVLAAVLLVAAGVFIGVSLARGAIDNSSPPSVPDGKETYGWRKGQDKRQEIEKKFPEH